MAYYHDPIIFGSAGNARDLVTSGIEFDSGPQSWTSRACSTIEIKLPLARGDVTLSLVATPFLDESRVPFQQVFFYWNGLFHHFHTFLGHDAVNFVIERVNLSTRSNRLALVIPTACSPKSVGLGEDQRTLGLSLSSLTLETT